MSRLPGEHDVVSLAVISRALEVLTKIQHSKTIQNSEELVRNGGGIGAGEIM